MISITLKVRPFIADRYERDSRDGYVRSCARDAYREEVLSLGAYAARLEQWSELVQDLHMELRFTIDDPLAFTKPFTVIKHPILKADYETLEFVCAENERDSRHMVGK